MKSTILICVVVLLISFEGSEGCSSKSTPAKPAVQSRPQTAEQGPPPPKSLSKNNPGSTHVEPEATTRAPTLPQPVMPSMTGCMDAGFPGSAAYNGCMQKYREDMVKYGKEMQAWNAQFGEATFVNDEDGRVDPGSNSIYSNGWLIKSYGGGATMNNINGAIRIKVKPDKRADQVKGEFIGGNTMQWALMKGGRQVGWVKVTPPAGVTAKGLKYKFSRGALSIWQG